MPSADCVSFDYAAHPQRSAILPERTRTVVASLRRASPADVSALAEDTRPAHRTLFVDLTPTCCQYYAGHYRGENFPCLVDYNVHIPSDTSVGCRAELTLAQMNAFASDIQSGLAALDGAHGLPNAQLSQEDKLLFAVIFACRAFVEFLRIHPYADGNGHAARFLVWAVLGRYGYWPKTWPIEPRPPHPDYSTMIWRYRRGDRRSLEQYVLSCM